MTLREALLSVEFVHGICPACSGTEPDHDADCRIARALSDSRPTGEPDLPEDERFVRLATAVMQLRDFLALHRKATGRSDVNIRKVLALLDEALRDNPAALGERGDPTREPSEADPDRDRPDGDATEGF